MDNQSLNEIIKIENAVNSFAAEIKRRMLEKLRQGYLGWDSKYSTDRLMIELNKDTVLVLKGEDISKNLVDIGARAMILWLRV